LAKRRLILKVLIVVAAILCLLVLVYTYIGRSTAEGIVDHKAITGVKEDVSYTILMNRTSDVGPLILLKDEDYEEYFSTGDGNVVVSESLEREVKKEYSVVNYFVNVEVDPEGYGTQPYRVSREIFNNIEVGNKVKFRWTRLTELPEIIELLPGSN
jgi:hypothetical protein